MWKYFIALADVKIYKRSVHSDERPFQFYKCESSFKRSCDMYAHIRETHADSKIFKCAKCSSKSKGGFRIHKRLHNDYLPDPFLIVWFQFKNLFFLVNKKSLETD